MSNVLTANETTVEMIAAFTNAQRRAEGAAGLPLLFPRTDGFIPFDVTVPSVAWTPALTVALFNLFATDCYYAAIPNEMMRYGTPYYKWFDENKDKFAEAFDADGDTQMRLSKRVARIVRNLFDFKLSDTRIQAIGQLEGVVKGRTLNVDVTSVLEWNAGDYGDKGTCFFGSNTHHRTEIHPSMGTVALRTYDETGKGNGRALIVPVGNGQPAFVYTNFYGAMTADTYDGVPNIGLRIAKAILEADSGFQWTHDTCHPRLDDTYVNGGASILSPAGAPWGNTPVRVTGVLAPPSWALGLKTKKKIYCACCDETYVQDTMTMTYGGSYVCDSCLGDHYHYCEDVGAYAHEGDVRFTPDDVAVTEGYWHDHCMICTFCTNTIWKPTHGQAHPRHKGIMAYDGNSNRRPCCQECAQTRLTYTEIDKYHYITNNLHYGWIPTATLYTCEATGMKTAQARMIDTVLDGEGRTFKVQRDIAFGYANSGEDGIKRFVRVEESWAIKAVAFEKEYLVALARQWRALQKIGITLDADAARAADAKAAKVEAGQ